MSSLIRQLISDTVKEVGDILSFSYARESDFDAIRGKKFPAALLLPLNYSTDRNGNSDRVLKYNVTVLFYDLDKKGGTEKDSQKILEKLDPIVDSFQAKLNLKSLTVEDDNTDDMTTDKVEISNESVRERIRFTADIVTGWEYSFTLSVPDTADYCNIYSN